MPFDKSWHILRLKAVRAAACIGWSSGPSRQCALQERHGNAWVEQGIPINRNIQRLLFAVLSLPWQMAERW